MSLEIKICGLRDAPNLRAALDSGADMVGFVFFPPSPRHVDLATATELMGEANGRALRVALVVDPDDALLEEISASARPDILQLHGKETPERMAEIKTRFGLPVMKAVGIGSADDIAAAQRYKGVADRILVDAKPPKDATRPGGLGATFDWHLLEALDPDLPFMLSGGLTVDNVAAAIKAVQPAGIDVSSGVESAPGIKDADKIRAFIANARAAT